MGRGVDMTQMVLEQFVLTDDRQFSYFPAHTCVHKIDDIFIHELRLTEFQKELFKLVFPNIKKGINVSEILSMTAKHFHSALDGIDSEFARPFSLWHKICDFIAIHTVRCVNEIDDFDLDGATYSHAMQIRNSTIDDWDLTVRSHNVLKREGITSLYTLSKLTTEDLRGFRNLGENSLIEIEKLLIKHGFRDMNRQEPDLTTVVMASTPLEQLGLSTRAYNSLMRAGIKNLGALLAMHDLEISDIRNIGINSIREICEVRDSFRSKQIKNEIKLDGDSSTERTNTDLFNQCVDRLIIDLDSLKNRMARYESFEISIHTVEGVDSQVFAFIKAFIDEGKTSIPRVIDKVLLSAREIDQPEVWVDFLLLLARLEDYLANFVSMNESLLLSEPEYENLNQLPFELVVDNVSAFLANLPANSIENPNWFSNYEEMHAQFKTQLILHDWTNALQVVIRQFYDSYLSFPNASGLAYAGFAPGGLNSKGAQAILLEYLESTRPLSCERDFEIIRARFSGETLDQIGKNVSLTRERVRQVIRNYSVDLDDTMQKTLKAKSLLEESNLQIRVSELFDSFGAMTYAELSQNLNVSEQDVAHLIPDKLQKFVLDGVSQRAGSAVWDKDDVLKILAIAGTYYFPLKTSDYEHLIQIGEIDGPSVQWIYAKFGNWSNACMLAGVEFPTPPRSDYKRLWSDQELVSFVVRYLNEDETTGGVRDYTLWKDRQTDHVPSGALIRNTFGTWSDAIKIALLQIREDKERRQ